MSSTKNSTQNERYKKLSSIIREKYDSSQSKFGEYFKNKYNFDPPYIIVKESAEMVSKTLNIPFPREYSREKPTALLWFDMNWERIESIVDSIQYKMENENGELILENKS